MRGRILLVDDNEDFLDSTRDVLEIDGFDVVTATSGEQSVALAAEQNFDVILMDIKMSGMNGVESLIEIKKHNPDAEVIMATAYTVQDLIQQALAEGARAVLQKPLKMNLLFEKIREIRNKGGFVLVADDNRALCDSLKDTLAGEGYQVVVAYDGEEALQKSHENNFDIILLDMKLPLLNGLEVYRGIKAVQPNTIAVIISGHVGEMNDLINQALDESAHTFLKKPLDMEKLLKVLNEACTAKRKGAYRKDDPGN